MSDQERAAAAITAEPTRAAALERLLTEARRLTRAEAGTVYVREGDLLRFASVHNDVLAGRLGEEALRRMVTAAPLHLRQTSIASYVVLTRATVNLADVYEIPLDRPYVFDKQFDAKFDYRTRSMLALPVRDARGAVIGVLQLINARTEAGEVAAFDAAAQGAVTALTEAVASSFPR